jgi:hypothetical protein
MHRRPHFIDAGGTSTMNANRVTSMPNKTLYRL